MYEMGRGSCTTSYPPITNKDMAQLQNFQALNPGTRRGLVQNVWFELQYATLAYNKATKNHLDPRKRGRESKRRFMFEQPGNPLCRMASLEKYLSKCPENALVFYLHPRRGECIGDLNWYTSETMA
ncbi:unnamed protein product, partial [Coregonus sp. 'balchen']